MRGPAELRGDDFTYRCAYHGDPRGFRGEETIADRGQPVYAAFSGGLVDRRTGD